MKERVCFVFYFVLCLMGSTETIFAQEKVISEGAIWKYYDKNEAPPLGWENSTSITAKWKSGPSGLGYGDSAVTTEINFGDDPSKKNITSYFSKSFVIQDPYKFIVYELNVEKDDGIILYLNGREILRKDMPFGDIDHSTKATSIIVDGTMESQLHTVILSPEDLKGGLNTISASVHQGRETSPDLIFNLELIGNNDPNKLPLLLKERTIKNLELNLRMQELTSKLENEKKELQLEFVQQDKNDLKVSVYVLVGLLLLTVFGSISWYIRFKNKYKLKVKEVVHLKESITHKDQEMMGITLNTLNSQQYLKELKKDLEKSTSGDAASIKKKLSKLTSQLEFHLEQDDDWDNLKKHFNAVHTGFFDKLLRQYSSLTESELRHCVFIKLHMQTKEIAKILHIDPRSVQASRYRIKKKMNLDESVDLKLYLQNF